MNDYVSQGDVLKVTVESIDRGGKVSLKLLEDLKPRAGAEPSRADRQGRTS